MPRRKRRHSRISRRQFLRYTLPASAAGVVAVLLLGHRADEAQRYAAQEEPAPTAAATSVPTRVTRDSTPLTPVVPVAQGGWTLDSNRGTIKGFADRTSAADGDLVGLYVSTPAPTFDIQVFRLGWYDAGASAARLIQVLPGLPGHVQPQPASDTATGLISASNWVLSTSLAVAGWPTGLYLLKLVATDGDQNYIPLVIRDDHNQHDFLFQHSTTTDQAYNSWGGKSLYDFNSSGNKTEGGTVAAVKVTFDRPYEGDGSGGTTLNWELNMVRWLESEGIDVTYASDLDVHRDATFADRVHAVIQAGHSEYWSKEMRDHLEAVRDAGKGLGFFTGDTGAWAVRFEPSSLGPDRVMVGYKSDRDPAIATDPPHATVHWRDAPLSRPTHQFFGVGTGAGVRRSADWVVEGIDAAPDLFANTGFANGDIVGNLVGYEYDGMWTAGAAASAPPGVQVLGRANVIPVNKIDALLDFNVSYVWDTGERPRPGRLSGMIESIEGNPNWTFAVQLTSSAGKVYFVYSPGGDHDPPARFPAGTGDEQVFISLGMGFYNSGWRTLERDLLADYNSVIGPPPPDLVIDALLLRGTLSVGQLAFTAPDGHAAVLSMPNGVPPEQAGWAVRTGHGQMTNGAAAPDGSSVLRLQADIPHGRRGDQAHSVVMRTNAGGLIVAVGSIQWSWALDGLGRHVDPLGNATTVDPRLQALTRNLLQALRSTSSAAAAAPS